MSDGQTYRLQDSYPVFDCGEQSLADLFRTKQSVLVIEDEEDANPALAFGLRREGFHVRSACDGAAALHGSERHWHHRPDVVVLDLARPSADALELLYELCGAAELDVPVIALTSRADSAVRAEALRLGVSHVLEKPVEAERLIARVRDVLAERERAR